MGLDRFARDRHVDHHARRHVEDGDGLRQALGLVTQGPRGCGCLLDQRGVLLRGLVHAGDRQVDLVDALRLLAGRGGDFTHDVGHAVHGVLDFSHGGPRKLHLLRARLNPAGGIGDQLFDFTGRQRAALRQRAHFAGHHRKTLALVAGASRLNGGV
ncbi:hypothetical protein D3C72_1340250 [compost metagenome]